MTTPFMLRWLVPLLYFASSVAALICELVWMRMLGGVLGVAFVATAIVLAAYMGGLGLGSACAGRWAPRHPLRSYGLIELSLAAWALALPYAMADAGEVLAVVLVVIPSTAIGATYPLLVQAMPPDHVQRAGGRIYAVGTFGGVAGVLVGGLWLLPALGTLGALRVAAALGVVVALATFALSHGVVSSSPRVKPPPAPGLLEQRRAVTIVALSGAAAMIYELVWFRALRMITSDTTRALSCVLAAFLIGIAIGAELAARWGRRRRFFWIGAMQIAIALYALLSPHLLRLLDQAVGQSPRSIPEQLGYSLLVLLLPATLLGATFPLALSLYGQRGRSSGRIAGAVYAASTFGAIAGVIGGALLVTWMGARAALLVGAAASTSAAWVAIRARWHVQTRRDNLLRWSHAPLAFAAATLLLWRGEAFFQAPPGELVARAEDSSGVVHVVRDAQGVVHLHANRSHRWGSDAPRMVEAMKLQGALPLVLHSAPESMIEIGLGTGVQLQPAVDDERVQSIDVVELSPAVVTGAHHFAHVNGGLLSHPKTHLIIADGRHYIETTPRTWDVIVLGLFTPYRPGAGRLFSHELYTACREHLAKDSVLVHWLPLAQLSPTALRSVIRTFIDVFPQAHAWQRAQYLALVSASEMPTRLARIDRHQIFAWLAAYSMGPAALATLAAGAPLNTRAHPVVELELGRPGTQQMLDNMQTVLEHREPPSVPLSSEVRSAVETAHRARGHALRSVMAEARGHQDEARAELRRAAALNPGDEIVRAQLIPAR